MRFYKCFKDTKLSILHSRDYFFKRKEQKSPYRQEELRVKKIMMFISQKAVAALLDNKQSMRDNPRGKIVLKGVIEINMATSLGNLFSFCSRLDFLQLLYCVFFFPVISSYTPTKCYVAREHIRQNVPHAIGKFQWK